MNVITIRPEEGCKELDQDAVSKIRLQNEERSRALRDSFYEGEQYHNAEGGV